MKPEHCVSVFCCCCCCCCCCCVFSFTIRLIVSCINVFVVSAVHTQVYSFSCVAVQYYRVSSNFKYYYIYISTRPIHNLSENKAAGWSKNPGTACYRKRKDPTAFENRKRSTIGKQTKPRPPPFQVQCLFLSIKATGHDVRTEKLIRVLSFSPPIMCLILPSGKIPRMLILRPPLLRIQGYQRLPSELDQNAALCALPAAKVMASTFAFLIDSASFPQTLFQIQSVINVCYWKQWGALELVIGCIIGFVLIPLMLTFRS